MMFAIKAEGNDSEAQTFAFTAQKTMYGGKHIAKGDTIFVFASENECGSGLIATGIVTSAKAITKKGHRPANAACEHHHQTHRAWDGPLVGEIQDRTLYLTDYSPRQVLAK
jgi:hypothetical protein